MKYKTIHCRKCGKPIAFVKTAQGANMPVDAEAIYAVEDPGGTLSIITDLGRIIRVREARPEDREKIIGNVLHWLSCSGAEEIKREYGAKRRQEEARKTVQEERKAVERREAESAERRPQEQIEQLKLFGG